MQEFLTSKKRQQLALQNGSVSDSIANCDLIKAPKCLINFSSENRVAEIKRNADANNLIEKPYLSFELTLTQGQITPCDSAPNLRWHQIHELRTRYAHPLRVWGRNILIRKLRDLGPLALPREIRYKEFGKKRLELGRFRGAGVTGGYFGILEVLGILVLQSNFLIFQKSKNFRDYQNHQNFRIFKISRISEI